MDSSIFLKLLALLYLVLLATTEDPTRTPDSIVSEFLDEVNKNLAELYNREILANWQSEIKGPNDVVALLESEIATQETIKYIKSIWTKILKYRRFRLNDKSLKRQLQQIPDIGYEVLNNEDLQLLYAITTNMSEVYKYVQLCDYKAHTQCNLTLVPDIQTRLEKSQNIDEIEYFWLQWRDKTGKAAKDNFIQFVELYKKTAKLNGYSKPSDFWFKDLEENSNEAMIMLDGFFKGLRPLFVQFHAHVRFALRKRYGENKISLNKPYPQSLAEIYIGRAFHPSDGVVNIKLPYPDIGLINITKALHERGLNNPQRLFWNVAEFFRSLGMQAIEDSFWLNNAKPKAFSDERYTTCSNRAWRYYGQDQLSFSYCNEIREEQFFNMFAAVSELYYYRATVNQTTIFQEEPFPNFIEAIGNMFALAASTPKFLESLKLIPPDVYTQTEARINRLYMQGLRTVFLMPVFYVLDLYRVKVVDNKINITDNCAYWQLVEQFNGAEPPVMRTNQDFDAPAKLLTEVDDEYTSQIMSIVLQFQLYKYFCELTGEYEKGNTAKPLDLCDLSNKRQIGPIIFQAMSLGSSKSYKEILKLMTNEDELNIDGILLYFSPLFEWLKSDNIRNNKDIGWSHSTACLAN